MKTSINMIDESRQSFLNEIQNEKERQPKVDTFYERLYPGCVIEIVDFEKSTRNKRLQRMDIDRIIHYKGDEICISEKFRDNDGWGLRDLVVEIYSDTRVKKPGWAIESEADYLFYYKDNKVCVVDAKGLKKVALSIMEHLRGKTRNDIPGFKKGKVVSYPLTIDGKLVNGKLMMPNPKYQSWETLNYIISIKDLENNSNINYLKVFDYATNW